MSTHIVRDAVLDYEIVLSVVVYMDPPEAGLLIHPRISGMRLQHLDDELCIDLKALLHSVDNEGEDYLLSCSCGWAPDAEINAPIAFTHPDEQVICWHFETSMHETLFEDDLPDDSRVTLRFERRAYIDTVQRMQREVAAWLAEPAAVEALKQLPRYGFANAENVLDAELIGKASALDLSFDPMRWSSDSPENWRALLTGFDARPQ